MVSKKGQNKIHNYQIRKRECPFSKYSAFRKKGCKIGVLRACSSQGLETSNTNYGQVFGLSQALQSSQLELLVMKQPVTKSVAKPHRGNTAAGLFRIRT